MKLTTTLSLGAGAAIIATLAGYAVVSDRASAGDRSSAAEAPVATPQGVTMQPPGKAQGYDLGKTTASAIARDQIAYTDTRGMTLYTWDKDPADKSTCIADCAESFVPFQAADTAHGIGDRSVITMHSLPDSVTWRREPTARSNGSTGATRCGLTGATGSRATSMATTAMTSWCRTIRTSC